MKIPSLESFVRLIARPSAAYYIRNKAPPLVPHVNNGTGRGHMSEALLNELRASRGQSGMVEELTRDALSIKPVEPRSLVDIGIIARDEGLRDRALAVFDVVVEEGSCRNIALYERAVLHLHEGKHFEALESILKVLESEPKEVRANILAAKLLFSVGDISGGDARINAIDTDMVSPNLREEMSVLLDFGRFVCRYPKSYILNVCHQVESSKKWIDVEHVASQASRALQEGRGFSVIRCGDGEGAFIRVSNVDEIEFSNLYRFNRLNRSNVWFDGSIDIDATGFTQAAFGLQRALGAADVVGLPYTGWLKHEHKILSATGISTLTNLLRIDLDSVPYFCTQQIHVELHRTGKIYELMRSVDTIGLISCHAQLPSKLIEKFGYKSIDYHYIPGEKGHKHLVAKEATVGEHWPEGFHRVIAGLQKPLAGRLYIVAAGILGKLYCEQIKKCGGVAIDMGSIADGWVGSSTRPGLNSLEFG